MSFFKLPTHIISDIFLKVPVDAIGRCRCVCKTWCDLLTHPHFINLHLSKSPDYLIVNDSGPLEVLRTLNLIEIDDEPDRHFVHKPSKTWHGGLESQLYLAGSVNGLLCLWQYGNDDTYIINPILKQSARLPKQKHVRKSQARVCYGFGLSPVKQQYKVVRIFQGNIPNESESEYVSECEVYTLGTQEWRNVGSVSFSVGINRAKFINGGLHYATRDEIFRFDLETESFHMFCSDLPPVLNQEAMYLTSFSELNGYLCRCDNSKGDVVVIWVMKEYGVKESWSKEIVISIKDSVPEWVGYEAVYPVRIFKDGSVLILWRDDKLITYCPRTKAFEELDIGMSDFDRIYEVMNFVPSLLDLKNIGLENVQVMVDLPGPIRLDPTKYNFYGILIQSD